MKRNTLKITALVVSAFALMFMASCKKKPVACFDYEVPANQVGNLLLSDSIYVGDLIYFKSCSENESRMQWNMGDGEKFTYPEVAHAYATPGAYPVTLDVYNDNDNNQDQYSEILVIYPQP